MPTGSLRALLITGFCFTLSACASTPVDRISQDKPPDKAADLGASDQSQTYLTDIEALASKVDRGFEDGWIAGHSSRVLKSGYRRIDPLIKAKFATAYNTFIEGQKQNLALDLETYVPYSKRFQFGLDWWRASEVAAQFEAETVKKKVVWVHESLLDASELFFRAYEKRNSKAMGSASVLAHDKEQDMVFDYMETPHKRGSYSETYVKWAKKLD
ncbi:MAG: hypothetical protein K8F91_22405 [Candidatus Obscuribacterales bacterium]|nr:hypothetical protein [Candidatus Obscuribacterales bacterium]